jgi:hypothetical protein
MNDFIKFLEKNHLSADEFVTLYKHKGYNYPLDSAQLKLLEEGLEFFKKSKSKPIPKQITNHPEMIKQYLELWPKMRLPSGKPARASEAVLIKCFTWFFNNYKYSWGTILTATQEYVIKQEMSGYKMCRTSQYFIDKSNGGIRESLLADYCMLIEEGDDINTTPFKENVV